MRKLALTLLLLAASGPAHHAMAAGDPPAAQPPPRADAPAERDTAVQPWSPEQRASMMHECENAFPGEGICACVTHQVELLSPDPAVVTAEAIQAGVKRCRRV